MIDNDDENGYVGTATKLGQLNWHLVVSVNWVDKVIIDRSSTLNFPSKTSIKYCVPIQHLRHGLTVLTHPQPHPHSTP